MVDVGEDGNAEARSGRRQHLDQLPPALEVLAQHQRRRLAHHGTAEAEQEAVTEIESIIVR